jgi:peptide/nickel transport system substrate-binding protein
VRKKFKGGLLATAFVFVASTTALAIPAAVSVSSAGAATQVPLNLANEQGELWSCAFNPFVPTSSPYSVGLTYETLDFVDSLKSGAVTPWLATNYAWSNANKTLTFTIRSGVKWSDGKPFSAADVAYTFNLLKKFPALDGNAVWSVLSSVTQKGANQVVMNFTAPAVPYFFYVAGQVPIVPEHVWSSIKNPVTYADSSPVGTGGYTMSHCTPQNIQWTANKNYWQKGKAVVSTVNMPAFLSNNTCNEYLATGQSQWGSQFIPNIKSYYVDKTAGNTYWFPPVANVTLFPNLKVAPLNDVAVREAISYAINRSTVSTKGEYGYEPPASQDGIVSPTFSSWTSSAALSKLGSAYNPAKAKSVLEADGYKMGSNGFFSKNGKELKLSIITNGGYSDWVASEQVMAQELGKVGIDATPETPSATTFASDVYTGNYQLAYDVESGGPTPFYEMRQWLFSKNSAPEGKAASTNWERFDSSSVDTLLNSYGSTTSAATQHTIINQLENVMVTQFPVIPILEEVDWFQYNSKDFTGFPSKTNPYAQPGLYNEPDWGYVLDNLKPVS